MDINPYYLIAIAAIVIGIVLFQKIRERIVINQELAASEDNYLMDTVDYSPSDLQIQFEMLPTTEQIDENKLVEIKDSKVLARINNLVPELFKTATTAGNAIQASSQVLYQVIIPKGEKLVESKVTKGAYRAFYRGKDKIKGQAELYKVDQTTNIATNATAAAMGVGSMIVGQYYMDQIHAELKMISEGISQIADFQNNEYKSKVFALISQIEKISTFQLEILENDELRANEIANLNDREHQCIELLGQANLTISDFSKNKNIKFNEYEKKVNDVHDWYIYQKALLEILYKISDLKYTLHLGTVSRQQCRALLPTYSKQVDGIIEQLVNWHEHQIGKHGISVDSKFRKRVGLDGLIHKLPGLINEDFYYRPIEEKTVDLINTQVTNHEGIDKKDRVDLFNEDVRVIAKEGKIYYLPDSIN